MLPKTNRENIIINQQSGETAQRGCLLREHDDYLSLNPQKPPKKSVMLVPVTTALCRAETGGAQRFACCQPSSGLSERLSRE